MQIEILFEDDNFLIVNKPNGLIVHSTLDKGRENLYDSLLKDRGEGELFLLHRLDKDTSGVILFTKNNEVNAFVQEGFKTHQFIKKYWAIVHGEWIIDDQVEDFLKKEKVKNKEIMVKVNKGGQKAISRVKTISSNKEKSLVEFTLLTGRMHQIRVQSALRGHPIIGDEIYGNKELDHKQKPERMFLHSKSLEFNFRDKTYFTTASLDQSFVNLINQIEKKYNEKK